MAVSGQQRWPGCHERIGRDLVFGWITGTQGPVPKRQALTAWTFAALQLKIFCHSRTRLDLRRTPSNGDGAVRPHVGALPVVAHSGTTTLGILRAAATPFRMPFVKRSQFPITEKPLWIRERTGAIRAVTAPTTGTSGTAGRHAAQEMPTVGMFSVSTQFVSPRRRALEDRR